MSAATIHTPAPGEPVAGSICVVPGCGVERQAMVFVWRPDGMSVFEPRCRDHKDGAS